jgi:hypothetical protein
MDIACDNSLPNPVRSATERVTPGVRPSTPWRNWSKTLHLGLVLLAALEFASPLCIGRPQPPLAKANSFGTGGLLLVLGLAALLLAGGEDRPLCLGALWAKSWGKVSSSSEGTLLLLDSLASFLGVWLILSPMALSMPWPGLGVGSLTLGSIIFLAAEAALLAELNRQVPPS